MSTVPTTASVFLNIPVPNTAKSQLESSARHSTESEPRFAACQSQGIPWFTSRGQWGARGYENIAPGDAIFFDWDLDGSADHVGLVIGTDGSRVYTVEGNSGDACKIKSYPLDYACIKGYGLMNWN